MQSHNLKMTSEVHVLIQHALMYVRPSRHPLGPTSEQALESQHTLFDIFYHRFEVNRTKSSAFRERLLKAVLHHNSWHL